MVQLRSFALATVWAAAIITPVAADVQGSLLWDSLYDNEANVYARIIELQHAGSDSGKLLSTWEHWYADNAEDAGSTNGTEGSYIIRQSEDGGETWSTLTTVYDTQDGPGHPCTRFWQPFLFEFPTQLGDYPEGTLLLVGNLVANDNSFTQFFTWRSTDHGLTWDPVGAWQEGGTSADGIWEPFLYVSSAGTLVAAFADERDNENHSQMLVQAVSMDGGDNWSEIIRTAASGVPEDRPGMPTVVQMDNGEFLMTYEICGRGAAGCLVHVKTSPDGVTWEEGDMGIPVRTDDGRYAGSSPYTVWDPSGNQLVLASQNVFDVDSDEPATESQRSVYINKNHGEGPWSWAPSPWALNNASPACNANYSPHLLLRSDGVIRYTAPTSTGPSGFCSVGTGEGPLPVLPYEADFAANDQAGWINTGAPGEVAWSVSGDEYTVGAVGGDSSALALTGSTGWTDYTVSAEVKIVDGAGEVGIVARVSQPKPGLDTFRGYTLSINSDSGDLTLSRNTDDAVELHSLASPGGIKADEWYTISLTVQGAEFRATLSSDQTEEELAFSVNDDSHEWGMPGLLAKVGGGSFRNVAVNEVV